jgi:hypothetical protein
MTPGIAEPLSPAIGVAAEWAHMGHVFSSTSSRSFTKTELEVCFGPSSTTTSALAHRSCVFVWLGIAVANRGPADPIKTSCRPFCLCSPDPNPGWGWREPGTGNHSPTGFRLAWPFFSTQARGACRGGRANPHTTAHNLFSRSWIFPCLCSSPFEAAKYTYTTDVLSQAAFQILTTGPGTWSPHCVLVPFPPAKDVVAAQIRALLRSCHSFYGF